MKIFKVDYIFLTGSIYIYIYIYYYIHAHLLYVYLVKKNRKAKHVGLYNLSVLFGIY